MGLFKLSGQQIRTLLKSHFLNASSVPFFQEVAVIIIENCPIMANILLVLFPKSFEGRTYHF